MYKTGYNLASVMHEHVSYFFFSEYLEELALIFINISLLKKNIIVYK